MWNTYIEWELIRSNELAYTYIYIYISWASSFQSIPPHPTSWRSILILSFHLRLGLPSQRNISLRIGLRCHSFRAFVMKLSKKMFKIWKNYGAWKICNGVVLIQINVKINTNKAVCITSDMLKHMSILFFKNSMNFWHFRTKLLRFHNTFTFNVWVLIESVVIWCLSP